MTEFEIRFEWLAQDVGSDFDRATFARLEIEVNGHIVTELEDSLAQTVRPALFAPAYDLAFWLASNWWRLRWEPLIPLAPVDWRLSHHIAGAASGTVWPNLRLWSSGQTVRLVGKPNPRTDVEAVRYLSYTDEYISADAFENGVDRFVDSVVARVASLIATVSPLQTTWDQVRAERADPECAAWRRTEAKLGFDPDDAPDSLLEALGGLAADVGEAAMEEIAVAAGAKAPAQLAELRTALYTSPRFIVPDAPSIQDAVGDVHFDPHRPWFLGLAAARSTRNHWGINEGPISTYTLSELLSLSSETILENPQTNASIPAGWRHDDGISVALPRHFVTARRFALARLVGDELLSPASDRLLPVTGARTTRQKIQRAFAQEFLCPYADLAAFVGDRANEEDVDAAAEHFAVSPVLIDSTLRNNYHSGYEP